MDLSPFPSPTLPLVVVGEGAIDAVAAKNWSGACGDNFTLGQVARCRSARGTDWLLQVELAILEPGEQIH